MTLKKYLLAATAALTLIPAFMSAQDTRTVSGATAVTRSTGKTTQAARRNVGAPTQEPTLKSDAPVSTIEWMRIVYRHLDLSKEKNATLCYPETSAEGEENLFRLMLRLLTENKIDAYEYLDGREVFTNEFAIDKGEMLARFNIPYSEKKTGGQIAGYVVDSNDVPASDVMSYYILEQWEFDNRKSRTSTNVLAVCPVLHITGDLGEDLRYPMFWVKMEDLRPYLKNTMIFIDDNDNTPRYSYDDYFVMNMYDGEIYKTRNVRNKSMMQLYPEEEARRHAADSIQKQLEDFDKALWAPSREDILEARKAKDELDSDTMSERKPRKSSARRPTRSRGSIESSRASQSAVRSVRDRK